MAELVSDCPRCGASRTTFDLLSQTITGYQYSWQQWYEVFCVCRHCGRSTVFVLSDREVDVRDHINKVGGLSSIKGSVNGLVRIEKFISLKDAAGTEAPEYLPEAIHAAFVEGAMCFAIGCHNAAATMFRLCVDLATRPLLPENDENGLNRKIRRDLGLRLPWLFDHSLVPEAMRELSSCIKEDGNDGAHVGSLGSEDAADLLDFTTALLERMYTEPERLKLAKKRREERRTSAQRNG